jgi:lipoprotein NlpD
MDYFQRFIEIMRHLCFASLMLLVGCMGFGRSVPAPVEERPVNKVKPVASTQPKVVAPVPIAAPDQVKSPASAPLENQNRLGFYTVKPGDTLIRIGLDHGQNWRDIIRWNSIENPNVIEVGQVLRIAPPTGDTAQEVAIAKPVQMGSISATNEEKKSQPIAEQPAVVSIRSEGSEDTFQLTWPAQGSISSTFDDSKNKGIDISGKTGDAVLAAADGKVVYAGSGLRGYGNLVILKHNNTFLTAYAHNQSLLVREDQSVKRGQKIAEMGNSDTDQVKLHFELRRLVKPVDPLKFLPNR